MTVLLPAWFLHPITAFSQLGTKVILFLFTVSGTDSIFPLFLEEVGDLGGFVPDSAGDLVEAD